MHDGTRELFAEFARRIEAHAVEHAIPGVCTGFVKSGDLVTVHGYGETRIGSRTVPDADAVFRIASMTKSFTAAAILLLRDRGRLRLDDAIATYVPWTASIGTPAGSAPITVRDLLTMNAGFPTDDPWGDRHESTPIAEFDALVAGGLSFSRMPRTGYEYSNLGYALLGRIVTAASGVDYLDFVARELLEPLGMRSTTFASANVDDARRAHGYVLLDAGPTPEPVTGPGAFSPMGGLHSTVRDLAIWVDGFASAWDADTPHPLRRSSRREMQEGRAFTGTAIVEAPPGDPARTITSLYANGLVMSIDSSLGTFIHHSGGYPGFGSHMRWHPASGWGIIMLANRSYAPVYDFAAGLLAELVAAFPPPADVAATLWPQTRDAMGVAERLLAVWDDTLAGEHFAHNVDLDTPRWERRIALATIANDIGPFERVATGWSSKSPAHVKWTVRGPGGEAELEILLTPERHPKLQTLKVDASDTAEAG